MARPVDSQKHAARRLHILDAALTRLAADGYAGATTAAICRAARIGSGTFFHYFPTKNAVLVAILDYGTSETRDWFAAQQDRSDARGVIVDWLEHSAKELEDPRSAGFVQAVSAVMTQPEVAAALHRDEVAEHEELQPWVSRAQTQGACARTYRLPRSPRGSSCCWTASLAGSPPSRTSPPPGSATSCSTPHSD